MATDLPECRLPGRLKRRMVRVWKARAIEMHLTDADRERLRYALAGREPDVSRSLFGPGSLTWHVNREAALLLGGGRALLMQVAHPLVAAGVAAYSDFRKDPLGHLRRTLDLTLTITATRTSDVSGMLRGPLLAVGPHAREIAASVLRPPLPRITQPVFWLTAALTIRLLPPTLRQRYGFGRQGMPELVAESVAWLARPTIALLPNTLRLMPHARRTM